MRQQSQSLLRHLPVTLPTNKIIWISGETTPFLQDFIVIKQLGDAGQYGIVYECKRKSDGKYFAVKYLTKKRFYGSERHLKMMRDEVNIIKILNHEYIIKLEDVYEDENTLYIVMEECKGGSLFDRIVNNRKRYGQYSENDAANIIKQLLLALRYLHEDGGIVHCDLKPENILFLTEHKDSPLKIIDFGMSKILPRLQYLTNLSGTPYYTAPEVKQKKQYNHSCDIWSVGIILFLIIYGYPPFYVDPRKYEKSVKSAKYTINAIYTKIAAGFEAKIKSTKQYGYGPWFPDHIKTSQEVRDLISKLLETDIKKRYTAKEALSHPWIIKRGNNNNNDIDSDSIIMSRLLRFDGKCPFKLAMTVLFRNEFYKMRYEHFEQLKKLFVKYDTNKDGILSFKEFKRAIDSMDDILNIDKKYLNTIYQQLTVSSSSSLSSIGIKFNDLLNALVFDYLISCDERLYDAFRKLDDDNDGRITINHLKRKLKVIDPLQRWGKWDKVIMLIREELIDQNYAISYKEFLLKLHPNFGITPEWIPNLFKKPVTKQNIDYIQNGHDVLTNDVTLLSKEAKYKKYTIKTVQNTNDNHSIGTPSINIESQLSHCDINSMFVNICGIFTS